MKPNPTETRARELFKIVTGYDFNEDSSAKLLFTMDESGWLKLARFVMRIEKKAKGKSK